MNDQQEDALRRLLVTGEVRVRAVTVRRLLVTIKDTRTSWEEGVTVCQCLRLLCFQKTCRGREPEFLDVWVDRSRAPAGVKAQRVGGWPEQPVRHWRDSDYGFFFCHDIKI